MPASANRLVFTACIMLALSLSASFANAQLLGFLGKGARATAGAARVLTRTEAMTLAGGLGAGAIYLEAGGGKVLLKALGGTSDELAGGTDDLIRLSQQAKSAARAASHQFVITSETLKQLGARLDPLLQQGEVFIIDPVAGPLKLIVQGAAGSRLAFKQIAPGIVTPADSIISQEVVDVLKASSRPERISVLSMFADTDVDSLRALGAAAGDRLLGTQARERMFTSKDFSALRDKTLVVVGHVEDGHFVARGAGGRVSHKVAIESLEQMAQDANVTLISAGCSSACFGSRVGFAEPLTDMAAAQGLREALGAPTLGGMLGAFGQGRPLVVSQESLHRFAELERLELTRDLHLAKQVAAGAVSVKLYSKRRTPMLSDETRGLLMFYYGLGVVCMLCMFRANREAFLRAWPVLPAPAFPSDQLRFAACWAAREAVFFALAPVFMALVAITWLFGGWQFRRQLLGFIWSFFRSPFKSLLLLVLGVMCMLVTIAAYCLVIGIAISIGLAITSFTLGLSGLGPAASALVWTLCLAYWIAACIGCYRLHRKFVAWEPGAAHPETT